MFALIVVAAVAVGAALSGGSSSGSGASGTATPVQSDAGLHFARTGGAAGPGAQMPRFSLTNLDGGTVRSSAFAGHPLVINFWASWCNPCRRDFPILRMAWRKRAATGLRVVGILFKDIPSDAKSFASSQHATWPMLRDDDGTTATAYGVRSVPTTLFVRADGTIAQRYFGAPTAQQFDDALRLITSP